MRVRLVTGLAALASMLVATAGCSFVFVHGPPSGHEQMESFSCTQSHLVPVLDLVGVGSSVIGAITAEDDPSLSEGGPLFGLSREENIVGNLAVGAVLATSAVVGCRRVGRCRRALEELARRTEGLALRRTGDGPQPLPLVAERRFGSYSPLFPTSSPED